MSQLRRSLTSQLLCERVLSYTSVTMAYQILLPRGQKKPIPDAIMINNRPNVDYGRGQAPIPILNYQTTEFSSWLIFFDSTQCCLCKSCVRITKSHQNPSHFWNSLGIKMQNNGKRVITQGWGEPAASTTKTDRVQVRNSARAARILWGWNSRNFQLPDDGWKYRKG